MSAVLLVAAWGVPLVLAAMLGIRATRGPALALAPWAAMPALVLALTTTPGIVVDMPVVLNGVRLGLDVTGRAFLLFSALLWLIAGIYARVYLAGDGHERRFWIFFLITEAGNLGLVLALDITSFYLAFALMTFAAYGLVVHSGEEGALRAGRVYLVMAVLGEAALLAGVLLFAGALTTLHLPVVLPAGAGPSGVMALASWLLFAGFGVKAGVLLLHMWLPLAHPVAPTPASAVLSGAMIKAGLLGWMRFLPLGHVALPELGTLCLVVGLLAAFYGVAVGLTQREPKTVLAYSSVSQMGFMVVGVGAGLHRPDAWSALAPAVTLYALHHGLAKGSLFLAVGVVPAVTATAKRWVLSGIAVAALALAGAPFTSGALAKSALKYGLAPMPDPWAALLALLLPLAAVGTTVIMARFFVVVAQTPPHADAGAGRLAGIWLVSVVAAASVAWLALGAGILEIDIAVSSILWPALWPVLAGIAVAVVFWRWPVLVPRALRVPLPVGDVLALIEPPVVAGWRGVVALAGWTDRQRVTGAERTHRAWRPGIASVETRWRRLTISGTLFLLVLGAFVLAVGRS